MIKKLFNKFMLWLVTTEFYKYVVLNILPFIRFTTYYTKMRGVVYHKAYNLLKPGHILLSIDKKKLSTFFIPGEWSHAAFCLSRDEKYEVAEMTQYHYTKSTFADFCFESDRVCILECPDWDSKYVKQIIEKCKSFEDAKYDVEFEMGVEALACSELIYMSDFERRLDVSLDDIGALGTEYISPTGLYEAKNVRIIYDSAWDEDLLLREK